MIETKAWIAIEINNGDCVTAYGPFDTNGEAMRFAAAYDGEVVVRKPPYPHLWRSQPSVRRKGEPKL